MAQPITTANAGNLVVPLSAIIDELQGKLSTADINALLLAVMTPNKTTVQPGDLITADLMNQILSSIATLNTRVTQLEAGVGTATGQVMIFRPLPGESFRAAHDMTIKGKNLGVSDGSSIIKLNGSPVTIYRPGASDEEVTVNLPNLTVPASGQPALLFIANGISSAERQIHLLPKEELIGHIPVSWMGANPLTPSTNSPLTLEFKAISHTNLDAIYTINPVISRVPNAAQWNAELEVLDEYQVSIASRQIAVASGGEANFFVRLKTIPAVPNDDAPFFALSVGATAGSVSDSSGLLIMRVSHPVELPDTNITWSYSSHGFIPNNAGSYDEDTEPDTITVKPGSIGIVRMDAEVIRGGHFVASVEVISGARNWSIAPVTTSTFAIEDNRGMIVEFRFSPDDNLGESGEASLRIKEADSDTSRYWLLSIKKG